MSFVCFLDGIRDEFEGVFRSLLERVAGDYGLDSRELIGRYIVADLHEYKFTVGAASPTTQRMLDALPPVQSQEAPVVPPVQSSSASGTDSQTVSKRGRKPGPGIESVDLSRSITRAQLDVLTIPTLKDICRQRGVKITGSKPELIERILSNQSDPSQGVRKKKGGRKKSVKSDEPVHSHVMDGGEHPDCEACSHGNPLVSVPVEFEIAPVEPQSPVVAQAVEEVPAAVSDAELDAIISSASASAPVSAPAPAPVATSPTSSTKSDAEILQDKLQGILAGIGTECEDPYDDDDDVLSFEEEDDDE